MAASYGREELDFVGFSRFEVETDGVDRVYYVYVIPKPLMNKFGGQISGYRPGIYFYFGKSRMTHNCTGDMYVGLSMEWLRRINEPHDEIEIEGSITLDEWREKCLDTVVVFTPSDKSLWDDNALDYIEGFFNTAAAEDGIYNVLNRRDSDEADIRSDNKLDILDDFIGKAADVLEELGYKVVYYT